MTITVRNCSECPFFKQTMMSLFAGIAMSKDGVDPLVGECDFPTSSGVRWKAFGAVGPDAEALRDAKMKRKRVRDGNQLPEECPLRSADVTVTLGS